MVTAFAQITWEGAFSEFLLHLEATRAPKTRRFYDVQLRQLLKWANENDVPFDSFGKRHLDRYLVFRQGQGIAPTTLHSDAVCAKAFFRWCQKYDLIERSLLAEYEVRKAPRPARFMPTDDEVLAILAAQRDFFDPNKNPDCRFNAPMKRAFHRDRNRAILLGLLDTACRIGEMLSLKIGDLQLKERQAVIRESKGREPRTVPVSAEWCAEVETWLKVRKKIMASVPPEEDEGWLFVSETGTRVDEQGFLKAVKRAARFAGVTDNFTLHSLRRYSLNRLAKTNLMATQQIAGHKDPKTTLLYTKLDADFIRDVHGQTGIIKGILKPVRPQRKRLV